MRMSVSRLINIRIPIINKKLKCKLLKLAQCLRPQRNRKIINHLNPTLFTGSAHLWNVTSTLFQSIVQKHLQLKGK